MARPITLNNNNLPVKYPLKEAHTLLRTPEDVVRRFQGDRHMMRWLLTKGVHILSRGDTRYERARAIADHVIYEETENPEHRTKIFPPLTTNGTFAIEYIGYDHYNRRETREVLDFTRSHFSHEESWRLLRNHIATRFEDTQAAIFDNTKFRSVVVPMLPIGGKAEVHVRRSKRNRLRVQDLDAFGRDT